MCFETKGWERERERERERANAPILMYLLSRSFVFSTISVESQISEGQGNANLGNIWQISSCWSDCYIKGKFGNYHAHHSCVEKTVKVVWAPPFRPFTISDQHSFQILITNWFVVVVFCFLFLFSPRYARLLHTSNICNYINDKTCIP